VTVPVRTILVVDDERDVRDAMVGTFARCGYRVLSATNGADALDVLAAEDDPPGLIVLDWMMPSMTGGELLERLALDPRNAEVPVLVVSAVDRATSIAGGQVAATLAKPVRLRTLIDVADRLFGVPRRRLITGEVPIELPDDPSTQTVRLRRPR
jgi:CheY-like chemotaxis protein